MDRESSLVDSKSTKIRMNTKAKMSKLEKDHKAMVNSKEFKEFWGYQNKYDSQITDDYRKQ